MYFISILCLFGVLCWFCKFILDRKELYFLSWKLPGPFAFPIIGNGLSFLYAPQDIFSKCVELVSTYQSPFRVWLGPKFVLVFTEVEQATKILMSSNFNQKDNVYDFLKIFTGEGLISGSGPKWKRDRKLMAPLFPKNNFDNHFSLIYIHTNFLLKILEKKVGVTFNVNKYLHRCCTDLVNESIFGVKTDAQSDGALDNILKKIDKMYDLVHLRITKVWLQNDFLFKLTRYYKSQEECKKTVDAFFNEVLQKKQKLRLNSIYKNNDLLDSILDLQDNENFATQKELIDHMLTIFSASEDTLATITSFTFLLLGMYPEIQEKVYTELKNVNLHIKQIELGDLQNLKYLEMCIKEILRLFPIAPFLLRKAADDFHIDNLKIPKNTSVLISIYSINRSPKYWAKPNDFYPEHFLPDAVKKRPTHSFLTFSTGPRFCLGQPLSYMALKTIIASFVKKFVIYADGNLESLQLQADISVRTKGKQYPIRIELRQKT